MGVSNDPPAKNLRFREKQAFPFDLLSDEKLLMALAYGAADSPEAGKARRISYLIGPGGRIAQVYGKVKAAEHPQQVLEELG